MIARHSLISRTVPFTVTESTPARSIVVTRRRQQIGGVIARVVVCDVLHSPIMLRESASGPSLSCRTIKPMSGVGGEPDMTRTSRK